MISEALLHIGLLVVVAKLTEAVLHRLGLVSIIGYTLAGVFLGPVAGIVEPTRDIQLFLSVGVFVLFFLIGIDELDLPGFMATVGGRYFVVGVISVVIPILASLIVTSDLLPVGFSLGLEFDKALCLAGILSLSSLGVVAKVLADKGLLKELIGLRIFTVVIIAEVASLLVVGVTIGEHEHGLSVSGIFILLIEIVGFAADYVVHLGKAASSGLYFAAALPERTGVVFRIAVWRAFSGGRWGRGNRPARLFGCLTVRGFAVRAAQSDAP